MYRINRPMLDAHPGMPPMAQGWQGIGGGLMFGIESGVTSHRRLVLHSDAPRFTVANANLRLRRPQCTVLQADSEKKGLSKDLRTSTSTTLEQCLIFTCPVPCALVARLDSLWRLSACWDDRPLTSSSRPFRLTGLTSPKSQQIQSSPVQALRASGPQGEAKGEHPVCLDRDHLLRTDMAPRARRPRANPLTIGTW